MGLVAMTPTCLPCRPVLASRGMDFFLCCDCPKSEYA